MDADPGDVLRLAARLDDGRQLPALAAFRCENAPVHRAAAGRLRRGAQGRRSSPATSTASRRSSTFVMRMLGRARGLSSGSSAAAFAPDRLQDAVAPLEQRLDFPLVDVLADGRLRRSRRRAGAGATAFPVRSSRARPPAPSGTSRAGAERRCVPGQEHHRGVRVVQVAIERASPVVDQRVERVGELELRRQVAPSAGRHAWPAWPAAAAARAHPCGAFEIAWQTSPAAMPLRSVLPVLLAGPVLRPALQYAALAVVLPRDGRRHEAEPEQAIEPVGREFALHGVGRCAPRRCRRRCGRRA